MIKIRGDRLTSAPEAQVVALPCSRAESPPIEVGLFYRNGLPPQATAASRLSEAINQAIMNRSKELFASAGPCEWVTGSGVTSAGAGDRTRWRGAFRTGPYASNAMIAVYMKPQDSGIAVNSYGRLDVYSDATESTLVTSTTFQYGVCPTGTINTDGWLYRKPIIQYIAVAPSTDYYVKFTDVDNGIMINATIAELPSMLDNLDGYLAQNFTARTPILDIHRQNPALILNSLLTEGGSKVLDFMVDVGASPQTTTSATAVNVQDLSSTTVSASTYGWTLEMSEKDRVSQTSGVPCVFKAFIKSSSGAQTATIYLKDSSSTIASIATTVTTAQWLSTTFNLPATLGKYDLQISITGGATVSLYAATVYEKG
jgi:hypothetical protein